MPKVQCINRTISFFSSHNTHPSKSVLRRNSCRSYQFIFGQNKSEKGKVQLKNKTGFGDNRLIGTSREEESMEGWSDQFLKSDSRTTTSYGTYSKLSPIHQIRIRIRFLVSVLWHFHLRGAHPLLQIHIYCTVKYCTMSLSLAKNHAHQSQTSSPVTTIAKRERSFGVDNDFKPRETFVGMYHIDNII